MSENLSRNQIQEQAMQLMYSFLIAQSLNKEIDFQKSVEEVTGMPYDLSDTYLRLLLVKALKYEKETIEYITPFLKNWKFERLNFCIQSILILSVTNYKYLDIMDKAVIVNVAIKLAKRYGENNDYKFVNAILDNCLNDSIRK